MSSHHHDRSSLTHSSKGHGMSSVNGATGGIKKIFKIVLTVAAVLVVVKLIGPIMETVNATANAGGQALGAVSALLNQITGAFADAVPAQPSAGGQ